MRTRGWLTIFSSTLISRHLLRISSFMHLFKLTDANICMAAIEEREIAVIILHGVGTQWHLCYCRRLSSLNHSNHPAIVNKHFEEEYYIHSFGRRRRRFVYRSTVYLHSFTCRSLKTNTSECVISVLCQPLVYQQYNVCYVSVCLCTFQLDIRSLIECSNNRRELHTGLLSCIHGK